MAGGNGWQAGPNTVELLFSLTILVINEVIL